MADLDCPHPPAKATALGAYSATQTIAQCGECGATFVTSKPVGRPAPKRRPVKVAPGQEPLFSADP